MGHGNEQRLRELSATFARGDLAGVLAGCTDDVIFAVPGFAWPSGTYSRDEFIPWIEGVMGRTGGTFKEDVVDVVANDEHGVLLVVHTFERAGTRHEYQTAHLVEFRGDQVSRWTEHPGSMKEFEAAWGRK